MPCSLRPFIFLCAAVLLPVATPAAPPGGVPEPPLPEPDDRSSASRPFDLLPRDLGPDGVPLPEADLPVAEPYHRDEDPIRESPVEPAPEGQSLEQLQDIEAPGAPSDGEPMPEMPVVPGLKLPVFRPAPLPGSGPGSSPANPLPGAPAAPALLPTPQFELSTKAKWTKSPYQAARQAREEQKPLLIFFAQLLNGAGPSAQLHDDLFLPDEFNQFASARLVLTKLQYPTGSPGKSFPEDKMAVLNMVKEKFKIRGFPALILLDDKGHEIERVTGYTRVRDKDGVVYSGAHTILERLKEAEKRFSERKQYRQERMARLTAQGYRTWFSTSGTSLVAKMVRANAQQIILMDENGAYRTVRPDQLKLYDAEWARRKQAGLLPEPEPPKETASAGSAAATAKP